LKILTFKSSAEFRSWLEKEHAGSDGIWLPIFKRGSSEESISYSQALGRALCYGWIDGQKQAYDERSWLQKFTPRGARSRWSRTNIGHVRRLMKGGQMARTGLDAVEAAIDINKKYADYDAVLIDDVGHYPMLEKPVEFNEKLREALKEFVAER
jgi:uncharacterized protein YdeI (YjbR/CyaY-like superfamily)